MRIKETFFMWFVSAIALLTVNSAEAGTATNTRTGTSYSDLQSAIDAALSGDRLDLSGSFTATSNLGFTIEDKSLDLVGSSQLEDTTPNPEGTTIQGFDRSRVLDIRETKSNQAYTIYLENLTIQNGNRQETNGGTNAGGGIYATGCQLYLSNCIVKNNKADGGSGGGIYVGDTIFTIGKPKYGASQISTIIDNNTADGMSGGGIAILNSGSKKDKCVINIEKCEITHNESTGQGGGGIVSNTAWVYIKDSKISDNVSFDGLGGRLGGGLYNSSDSIMEITECEISSNLADSGSGILNESDLTIISTNITGNGKNDGESDTLGGGLYVGKYSYDTKIESCTITGNLASTGGGIYYNDKKNDDILAITNSDVSDNSVGNLYLKDDGTTVTTPIASYP